MGKHCGADMQKEVRTSILSLSGRARRDKTREWAESLGISEGTIYRWCKDRHGKRRQRSDKGTSRTPVNDDALSRMQALTVRYGMTAEEVIQHAQAHGWIEQDAISTSTYNRHLKRCGISRRNLKKPGRMDGKEAKTRLKVQPHRRFESPYSNDIHQIDVTEMPRYYIEDDRSIGYESPLTKSKNKAGNRRARIHLFALIDDHSRSIFARFYTSKNVLNWIDFCIRAWEQKADHTSFPFCGRPEILYSDNDSMSQSDLWKGFMEDMEVEFQSHTVGNPAAKGKIERALGVLSGRTETIFRAYLDQGIDISLTEANEILHDVLYQQNYRSHSTTGQPPLERWQIGMMGRHARLMPDREVAQRYFYDSREVLLRGDLTLQIFGKHFQAPKEQPFLSYIGEKITVHYHRSDPGAYPLTLIIDDEPYPIDPAEAVPDMARKFKSLPKTEAEQQIEAAYETDLDGFEAGRIYKQEYARRMFPAQSEEWDEEKITGPRKMLTPISVKLRLRSAGIPYQDTDIDTAFRGRSEIHEDEYTALLTRLQA